MPRIRTIKPEFWTNPQVVRCTFAARLFFIGTWNHADDYGNLPRDAETLKMRVYPGDVIDVEPLILELIAHGLLIEYSMSDQCYLHIPTFRKHQLINRPSNPVYPLPDKAFVDSAIKALNTSSMNMHVSLTEDSRPEGERKGKRKGSKPKTEGTNERGADTPARARVYAREPTGDPRPPDAGDPEGNAPAPITPAMLSAAMRRNSISASPSDPRIIAAAGNGITPETIEAACVEAKEANKGGRISVGYVLRIAERWTQEASRMATHVNGNAVPARVAGAPVFDERSKDRKRAVDELTGRHRQRVADALNVIDLDMPEISHEPRHP